MKLKTFLKTIVAAVTALFVAPQVLAKETETLQDHQKANPLRVFDDVCHYEHEPLEPFPMLGSDVMGGYEEFPSPRTKLVHRKDCPANKGLRCDGFESLGQDTSLVL